MVSIPACHAGDRGSIPRRGVFFIKDHHLMISKFKMVHLESTQTRRFREKEKVHFKIGGYRLLG